MILLVEQRCEQKWGPQSPLSVEQSAENVPIRKYHKIIKIKNEQSVIPGAFRALSLAWSSPSEVSSGEPSLDCPCSFTRPMAAMASSLVFTSCRAVLPLKIAWIFVAAASKSAPATVSSDLAPTLTTPKFLGLSVICDGFPLDGELWEASVGSTSALTALGRSAIDPLGLLPCVWDISLIRLSRFSRSLGGVFFLALGNRRVKPDLLSTCGWDKVAETSVALPLLAVKKSCDTVGCTDCDSGSAERGAANSKPLPNFGASDDCGWPTACVVSKKLRSDI